MTEKDKKKISPTFLRDTLTLYRLTHEHGKTNIITCELSEDYDLTGRIQDGPSLRCPQREIIDPLLPLEFTAKAMV